MIASGTLLGKDCLEISGEATAEGTGVCSCVIIASTSLSVLPDSYEISL
jgi:hypothetical protein